MPDVELVRPFALAAVLLPLAAGLIVLILPDTVVARLREFAATIMGLGTLCCAVALYAVSGSGGQSVSVAELPGLKLPGTSLTLDVSLGFYVDRLALLAVLAACALTFLVLVYAWGGVKQDGRRGEFFAYALWALAGANLALLSDNLLLMLVGWEVTSIMLFYLITVGGDRARHSAGKAMVMLGAADCALLLGVVLLMVTTATGNGGRLSGIIAGGKIGLSGPGTGVAVAAFLLVVFGALTKAGAVPVHSWVPKAAEGAPAATMALLPASLDKLLGIYLLARACLFVFDLRSAAWLQVVLVIIGGSTVILAVMAALVQHDLKKLLSYHAVSQVGYMVLGIASGTALGVAGALFHMLNNAIYKNVLFLGAGAIEKRTGTTELERLGGLGRRMPYTFASMLIAALAISGVPLFNGFASKWMVYGGLLESAYSPPAGTSCAQLYTVIAIFGLVSAMFGSALTLASFVKVIHSAFMGPATRECEAARPAPFSMRLPMYVMSLACLVLGVFPHFVIYNPFLTRIVVDAGLVSVADVLPQSGMSFAPGAGGFWSPMLAGVLILGALMAGGIFYMMAGVGRSRTVRPFVSGETTAFSAEELRVPGTGFYSTVMELGLLSTIYRDAAEGAYDPYEVLGSCGSRVVELGRRVHDGVLSTYLGFCMLGLLAVLAALLAPLLGLW